MRHLSMCRRYEGVLFQFQNVPEEHLLAGPKFHLNTSNGSGIIKNLFYFSKATNTRNLALLKPVKFRNFGDFTQLAIKRFPQSIFWWGFLTIFYIDLGFQPHQI